MPLLWPARCQLLERAMRTRRRRRPAAHLLTTAGTSPRATRQRLRHRHPRPRQHRAAAVHRPGRANGRSRALPRRHCRPRRFFLILLLRRTPQMMMMAMVMATLMSEITWHLPHGHRHQRSWLAWTRCTAPRTCHDRPLKINPDASFSFPHPCPMQALPLFFFFYGSLTGELKGCWLGLPASGSTPTIFFVVIATCCCCCCCCCVSAIRNRWWNASSTPVPDSAEHSKDLLFFFSTCFCKRKATRRTEFPAIPPT
ncbi:hypothetical protein BC828DRAFT_234558 [Blastocladiella britannica]|nr:hypothetical protein BC828DRAFT_234558 [Blastocladiella britannica]